MTVISETGNGGSVSGSTVLSRIRGSRLLYIILDNFVWVLVGALLLVALIGAIVLVMKLKGDKKP